MKTQVPAMFKIGLTALIAVPQHSHLLKLLTTLQLPTLQLPSASSVLQVSPSRDRHPPDMDMVHSARLCIRPPARLCIRPNAGRNM
jgi:hypothetical protein